MNDFIRSTRTTFAACFLLGSIVGTVLAQSPSPQTKRAENPALKRFGREITFYLSFDDEAIQADLANGKSEPTTVDGEPQYLPGLYGKAMLLSGVSKSGAWVSVDYPTLDNVDLTKPGAAAVWLSPHGWVRGDVEDLFYPIKIMSGGAQLMFGRQGQLINPLRRNDMVFLWAKVGETKDISLPGGGSLDWKNGGWHLWVMNWRSNSIEFSLDGGAPQRQDLPAKIPPDGDRAGHFIIAMQVASCRYLLDEIFVLDRPLDGDEIKWMYEQGMNTEKTKTAK
ncbi:MAG: hypothetical protein HY360_15440 [Verrucomicrobia bacterium]|nr:hypothetical protein [Verrucomicrobiota bacterium]